jgi:hypothetical protein
MLTLTDVLVPASGVASRESEGELVVVIPRRGRYLVLNGTGAEVFRLMDGQRALDEIAAALSERYGVPLERVRADVLSLAERLLGRGAVRRQGEESQV